MEFTVKGKKVSPRRILDLPDQKMIRVIMPEIGPVEITGKDYGGGIFELSKANLKKLVQDKIDELTK